MEIKNIYLLAIVSLIATTLTFAQDVKVKDGDDYTLLQFNDEGKVGSVTIPRSRISPSPFTDKLLT